jgi:hypothetical protein
MNIILNAVVTSKLFSSVYISRLKGVFGKSSMQLLDCSLHIVQQTFISFNYLTLEIMRVKLEMPS